jgi:hypothetical protein
VQSAGKNQHEVIQAKMLTATYAYDTTMRSYVQLSNTVQVTEIIHYALIHSTLWGKNRTASVYQITVSVR